MAVTLKPPPREQEFVPELPSAVLPPPEVRDLPEPPKRMWRLIGPGVVGAGVGLASGEFILSPYITSQVGLIFLWGALLGVVVTDAGAAWAPIARRRTLASDASIRSDACETFAVVDQQASAMVRRSAGM